MSTLEDIRRITGPTRPAPGTGGGLTKVSRGLFIAPFEDISSRDAFESRPVSVGLVVNAGAAGGQCDTDTGFYGDEVEVHRIEIADDNSADAMSHFREVNQKISDTVASGKAAVVHCKASISRGTVFTIAYLMEAEGLTAVEATARLAEVWPRTWPNDGFVEQLIDFESELRRK